MEEILLAFAGFAMVAIFMALIMTKRLTPTVALITIPIIAAFLLGTSTAQIGQMALDGVKVLAPTGVMLMFAILYFGVMIDAGLFEPMVRTIVRLVEGDPLKVALGTAGLAAAVSLDGDGSTTYMIVVASMLPLYRRLGMNALVLTCVTMLASGVMNMTPWGGPLARAASALQLEPNDLFIPMLPSMATGIVGVITIAFYLGVKERRRLGFVPANAATASASLSAAARQPIDYAELAYEESVALEPDAETASATARPRLLPINAALTLALMVALVMQLLPLPVLFMVGFALALLINYPKMADQRARIVAHSNNVISVVSIIFAAGVFTGILNGTGMVTAMSDAFVSSIPDSWGSYMSPIVAVASMPFTFFISNDAFYFGVLPVVAEAGGHFGVAPVEIARASLIGQPVHILSPLVPSTFLLVGLAGVELGDHQRFTLKWAVAICLLMGVVGLVSGAFSIGA